MVAPPSSAARGVKSPAGDGWKANCDRTENRCQRPGRTRGYCRATARVSAGPDDAGGRRHDHVFECGPCRCGGGQLGETAQGPLSYLGSPTAPAVSATTSNTCATRSRAQIGVTQDWPVVIVGIGNLGTRWPTTPGFRSRGFTGGRPAGRGPRCQRASRWRGSTYAHCRTWSPSRGGQRGRSASSPLRPVRARTSPTDSYAPGSPRSSTSRPAMLVVPDGVDVRKVDLSLELQILAYHEQRKVNLRSGSSAEVRLVSVLSWASLTRPPRRGARAARPRSPTAWSN
jgi:redox-sensing transcriptional repressor